MNTSRIFLLIIGCILTIASHTTHAAKKPTICNNTYALCSSALCKPIPGSPKKVLCSCSVLKGKNMGYSACAKRKVRKTVSGQHTLLSTFSLGDGHQQYITCPNSTPWANCLDKPCIIEKNAPSQRKAYCTCNIVRKKSYVTFAGKCNPKNCHKAIWSGASFKSNQQFIKAFGMDPNQAQCPTEK